MFHFIIGIVILISEICTVKCQTFTPDLKEQCAERLLRECNNKYKTNWNFYPQNTDDLKEHCKIQLQNERCFNNTWQQCFPDGSERQKFLDAAKSFSAPHHQHLCDLTSSYSIAFQKHGKCLSETIVEQRKCTSKYGVLMQERKKLLKSVGYGNKNNTKEENKEKIKQICCWWGEYQRCIIEVARKRCSEEAALLVNDEIHKKFTNGPSEKVLTYSFCIPHDKTLSFPLCVLDNSKDPQVFGFVNNNDNVNGNNDKGNDEESDADDKLIKEMNAVMAEGSHENSGQNIYIQSFVTVFIPLLILLQ